MVTISVRTPDGKGFLKQTQDVFTWGTGAVMTWCSSQHHQWPLLM